MGSCGQVYCTSHLTMPGGDIPGRCRCLSTGHIISAAKIKSCLDSSVRRNLGPLTVSPRTDINLTTTNTSRGYRSRLSTSNPPEVIVWAYYCSTANAHAKAAGHRKINCLHFSCRTYDLLVISVHRTLVREQTYKHAYLQGYWPRQLVSKESGPWFIVEAQLCSIEVALQTAVTLRKPHG